MAMIILPSFGAAGLKSYYAWQIPVSKNHLRALICVLPNIDPIWSRYDQWRINH